MTGIGKTHVKNGVLIGARVDRGDLVIEESTGLREKYMGYKPSGRSPLLR